MTLGLTIMAKQETGLDYHLGQELVVEDSLGEGEPVPLLLPEPDLTNEKRVLRVLTNEEGVLRGLTNEKRVLGVLTNEERVLPGQ